MFDTVQIWKINHCRVSCDISNFSAHPKGVSRSNQARGNNSDLPTFIDKNTYKKYKLSNSQNIF